MKPERWKPICISVIVCSVILVSILWNEIGNKEDQMNEEIRMSYEKGKEEGAEEAYRTGYDDGYNNGYDDGHSAAEEVMHLDETNDGVDNMQSSEKPEELPDIILSDEILESLEGLNSGCWEDLFEYVIDHESSMPEDDYETLYDVCTWGENTAGVISDCLDYGSDGEPLHDDIVRLLQKLSKDPCWEYLSYYIDDNESYMTEDDLYILNYVCEWAEEAFYALNRCLDEA